jgi:undecaprenyl-diphosphatase
MPTTLQAALLGAIQGVTEFLPVSSTAHLLLGERWLGYDDAGGVFAVMIQLGSILAIVTMYRAKIVDIIGGLTSRPDARHFALAIVVATVPALIAGAFFADFVTGVLYETPATFAAAFVLGGLVMLAVERAGPRPTIQNAERTPLVRAFGVGLCQMLALIPGVSRSGATIIGGMAMGLDRPAAAEFSFFLAIPALTAAFSYQLLEVRQHLSPDRGLEIGIGLVVAFVASLAVIKPFLALVRRTGFAPFAWYRIGVGLALFAAIAAGWL